jgi:hypothetical protein
VDGHYTAEGEDAKHFGPVDNQPGKQQEHDCESLQPMPEAAVGIVHVDGFSSGPTLRLLAG